MYQKNYHVTPSTAVKIDTLSSSETAALPELRVVFEIQYSVGNASLNQVC
jgi:hypothetical protein